MPIVALTQSGPARTGALAKVMPPAPARPLKRLEPLSRGRASLPLADRLARGVLSDPALAPQKELQAILAHPATPGRRWPRPSAGAPMRWHVARRTVAARECRRRDDRRPSPD